MLYQNDIISNKKSNVKQEKIMNPLEFKGPVVSEEEKQDFQEVFNKLNEGFDILAKRNTTLAVFETYINHLFDKGNSYYEAKTKVQKALDNVIEKENMGSKSLIEDTNALMNSIFESRKVTQNLVNNIGKHLNNINVRYTNHKTRSAVESYKVPEITTNEESEKMGRAFIRHYIESFASGLIANCFPEDFKQYFE